MTKIEEVARALCDRDPDAMIPQSGAEVIRSVVENPYGARVSIDLPPIPAWKLFEAKARAAIEAMREPTERMMQANHAWRIDLEFGEGMLADVWRAMIDAALSKDRGEAQK